MHIPVAARHTTIPHGSTSSEFHLFMVSRGHTSHDKKNNNNDCKRCLIHSGRPRREHRHMTRNESLSHLAARTNDATDNAGMARTGTESTGDLRAQAMCAPLEAMISWKSDLAGDVTRRIDATGMIRNESNHDQAEQVTRHQSNTCEHELEQHTQTISPCTWRASCTYCGMRCKDHEQCMCTAMWHTATKP